MKKRYATQAQPMTPLGGERLEGLAEVVTFCLKTLCQDTCYADVKRAKEYQARRATQLKKSASRGTTARVLAVIKKPPIVLVNLEALCEALDLATVRGQEASLNLKQKQLLVWAAWEGFCLSAPKTPCAYTASLSSIIVCAKTGRETCLSPTDQTTPEASRQAYMLFEEDYVRHLISSIDKHVTDEVSRLRLFLIAIGGVLSWKTLAIVQEIDPNKTKLINDWVASFEKDREIRMSPYHLEKYKSVLPLENLMFEALLAYPNQAGFLQEGVDLHHQFLVDDTTKPHVAALQDALCRYQLKTEEAMRLKQVVTYKDIVLLALAACEGYCRLYAPQAKTARLKSVLSNLEKTAKQTREKSLFSEQSQSDDFDNAARVLYRSFEAHFKQQLESLDASGTQERLLHQLKNEILVSVGLRDTTRNIEDVLPSPPSVKKATSKRGAQTAELKVDSASPNKHAAVPSPAGTPTRKTPRRQAPGTPSTAFKGLAVVGATPSPPKSGVKPEAFPGGGSKP
jgi:hypothetical protein